MSTIATLKSRLDTIGVSSLKAPLRRLVRWYLAPSGLVLLAASALLILAFLDWGPGWAFGGAGVAALTVFLTYRFSRQQGLLLGALENHQRTNTEQLGSLRKLHDELTRSVRSLSEQITAHVGTLNGDIRSVGQQVDGFRTDLEQATARTSSRTAGLDYRMRLMGDGQKDLRINAVSTQARVDDLETQTTAFEAQRALLSEVQRSVGELHVIVEEARALAAEANEQAEKAGARASEAKQQADAPESDTTVAVGAETLGTLRSDMALWAASSTNQSFNGVTIVVSPERSGTTWVFDILRSLPGASQMATSHVYRTLGIAGNRYPKDLADGNPAGEAIELRDGVGAFLPRLRQQTFGDSDRDLLAVEKIHPSAFDFEPAALLGSLGRLEQSVGRVQLVLLIRDPVDAYRSFVSYQETAGWHSGVATESVGQFFASSLSTMQRLRSLHEGCLVVSYEDLIAEPVASYTNIADRLGLKADATAVTHVLTAADRWRTDAAKSPYFSASRRKAKASQLIVGKGLPSASEREALEAARLSYEDLWSSRIS